MEIHEHPSRRTELLSTKELLEGVSKVITTWTLMPMIAKCFAHFGIHMAFMVLHLLMVYLWVTMST